MNALQKLPVVTIRASALAELFDCPARFYAKQILGLRTPGNAKSTLGTAVHASTAVYDQSVIDGAGITIEDAKAAAVDAIYKPEYDVDWEDSSPQEAEAIALALHTKYCVEVAPRHEFAAVEVKCERLEISDLGIALTGTTDRVRFTGDGYGIVDLKTGKSAVGSDGAVSTKGHAFQQGVYELLAEAASGLPITAPAEIIGMNTAKTEKAQRTGMGFIAGAREVLLGDEDSPGVLQTAAGMIHAGNFFGNPRSMLCHKTYCPVYQTCKYRK